MTIAGGVCDAVYSCSAASNSLIDFFLTLSQASFRLNQGALVVCQLRLAGVKQDQEEQRFR